MVQRKYILAISTLISLLGAAPVFAEGTEITFGVAVSETPVLEVIVYDNDDNEITSGSTTINSVPTMEHASFDSTNVKVKVGTSNEAGYTLTYYASNPNLTSSSNNTIDSLGSGNYYCTTALNNVNSDECTFTLNSWGYRLSTDAANTYKAIPSSISPAKVSESDAPTNGTTAVLNFATRISNSHSAGIYATILNFIAVANPNLYNITFDGDSGVNNFVVNGSTVAKGSSVVLTENEAYPITVNYNSGYEAADANALVVTSGNSTLSGNNLTVGSGQSTVYAHSKQSKTYLYNYGVFSTVSESSWANATFAEKHGYSTCGGSKTFTKNSNNLYFYNQCTSNPAQATYMDYYTSIDLTGYKTLNVLASGDLHEGGEGYAAIALSASKIKPGGHSGGKWWTEALTTGHIWSHWASKHEAYFCSSSANYYNATNTCVSYSTFGNTTFSADISSLSGTYYIAVEAIARITNDYAKLNVYQIWLEK